MTIYCDITAGGGDTQIHFGVWFPEVSIYEKQIRISLINNFYSILKKKRGINTQKKGVNWIKMS